MTDYRRFREVFDRAGYTDVGLVRALGPVEISAHGISNLGLHLHRTRSGGALDTLIRMFLLDLPVPAEQARQALAPVALKEWVDAGFLEFRDSAVSAKFRIQANRGFLVAADHPEKEDRADQVMGMTSSTMALANFAVRRRVRRTLDIGTGNGFQTLCAAAHSDGVVATDTSPRALEFARFAAELNGVENVEFRQGSLFEPVRGETFDLIVANPPFAVSPESRYLYRDSGFGLDRIAERIVRGAPEHLNTGGYCQLVCDWIHPAGGNWKDRLASWLEGSACDAWVLRVETQDPAAYAQSWTRDTSTNLETAFREWMAYYDREGVEAISSGLIAMHRSGRGQGSVRIEDAPDNIAGPFGDAVELGFRTFGYLRATTDAALLEEVFHASPHLRLEQQCTHEADRWQIVSAVIRLERGLPYRGNVDRRVIELIGRCDGRRTLREVLAIFPESALADCVAIVRKLVERGFLVPEPVQ